MATAGSAVLAATLTVAAAGRLSVLIGAWVATTVALLALLHRADDPGRRTATRRALGSLGPGDLGLVAAGAIVVAVSGDPGLDRLGGAASALAERQLSLAGLPGGQRPGRRGRAHRARGPGPRLSVAAAELVGGHPGRAHTDLGPAARRGGQRRSRPAAALDGPGRCGAGGAVAPGRRLARHHRRLGRRRCAPATTPRGCWPRRRRRRWASCSWPSRSAHHWPPSPTSSATRCTSRLASSAPATRSVRPSGAAATPPAQPLGGRCRRGWRPRSASVSVVAGAAALVVHGAEAWIVGGALAATAGAATWAWLGRAPVGAGPLVAGIVSIAALTAGYLVARLVPRALPGQFRPRGRGGLGRRPRRVGGPGRPRRRPDRRGTAPDARPPHGRGGVVLRSTPDPRQSPPGPRRRLGRGARIDLRWG